MSIDVNVQNDLVIVTESSEDITVNVSNAAGPQGPPGTNGVGVPVGGTTGQVLKKFTNTNYDTYWAADASGLTSVGLSMPSAFAVSNSPLTSNGTLAVTGAGTADQYVRGDGQLANFPTNGGGGSSVNYYLNGSVTQGTFGGDTYYEMSKSPIAGAGTDFTRTSAQGNGYIASFITDVNDPSLLLIPGGNWNLEFYFSASSGGGTPSFYAELYKVSSSNVFTLVASGSSNPEGITQGTVVDQYFTSIPVPQTALLATDRLAIRIFVTPSGRTITLHTENSNLCEVLTTFSTGLNALNGLTSQVQYFATGTSGTDFAISSVTDTHTFNLPTASGTNRGALSSADWGVFNAKVGGTGASGQVAYWNGTNSQTGSATLTYTPTSALLVNNSVTAASAIARGTNLTPTLVAAANNDVLVGLDINPTFTNGAFTGVRNIGIRLINTIASISGGFRDSPDLLLQGTIWNSSIGPVNMSGAIRITAATYPVSGFNLNPSISKISFLVASDNNNPTEQFFINSNGRIGSNGGVILNAPSTNIIYDLILDNQGSATASTPISSNRIVLKGKAWNSAQGGVNNIAYLQVQNVVNNANPTTDKLSFFVGSASNTNSGDSTGNATERMLLRSDGVTSIFSASNEALRVFSNGNLLLQNGGTFTDGGQRLQVQGTGYFSDSVGIGSTSLTGYGLRVSKTITGSIISGGIYNDGQVQSDVTSAVRMYRSQLNIVNSVFTIADVYHYIAEQGTIGASSTVTNQYGFITGDLTKGTNNYGFYGSIAAGTGRWNLYMNGTANNYLAGSLGIGATSLTNVNLRIEKNITGNTVAFNIGAFGTVLSDVTNQVRYVATSVNTQAASFTLGNAFHFYAEQGTIGLGSSITNQYGYFVNNTLIGATNNYGFYGNIPSGTNRWNLYMAGTADNYLAGKLLIGTTTVGTYSLDVNGTARVSYSDNNYGQGFYIQNTNTGTSAITGMLLRTSAGTDVAAFSYYPSNYIEVSQRNTAVFATVTTQKLGFQACASGGSNAAQDIWFSNKGGQFNATLFSTGNLLIQNGGTFSDNGNRLQVTGNGYFSGRVGVGTSNPQENVHISATNAGLDIDGTTSSRTYYNRSGAYIWSTGLRAGDTKFYIYDERVGERFTIDDSGNVGIINATPTAALDTPASTTSRATMRIRSGVAPTTPNNGDIWFDGTDLKMRIGGVTKTFTLV